MEDFWLIVIVFYSISGIIFAWGCGYLAKEKGKSVGDWRIMGFFLSFIALLIIGLTPKATKKDKAVLIKNIPEIFEDPCEECGAIDFEYDSYCDELTCNQCGWNIALAVYSKKSAEKEKMAEKIKKEEALSNERTAKALLLGFSIKDETKECPACAATIKIKAFLCRFCQEEFSDEEIQKAVQNKVDAFLTDHNQNIY